MANRGESEGRMWLKAFVGVDSESLGLNTKERCGGGDMLAVNVNSFK